MPESNPKLTREFEVGSEIPILSHSGCTGIVGIVTKLEGFKYEPMTAKCTNPKCLTRAVMINWAQVKSNREVIKSKPKSSQTF